MSVRTAAALALVLVTGCSDGGGGDAPVDALVRCPLGDPAAAPEMEIVHLDADLTVVETMPDAEVPLIVPPQGGWILMLGVRATNIDGCQLNLTTSFRDVDDPAIIKLDQRPAKLEPTSDGWGISTPSTVGNLPICPQVTALRDLYDQPYVVTVAIEDIDGKRASRDLTIIPTCPAGDPRCTCECDRDYVLGGPCPPAAR
ncbi:MAG TPA: hypothetical protein VM513_33985 [Kofleriaceae bacterium]|nr:hypothetical protein [Kofleriaceae bacterium]